MAQDWGAGLSGLGGAVGSLFGASGDKAEASAYRTAASIAAGNAQITQQSVGIQQTQAQRKIFQVEGAQQAEVGGAGFAQTGSAGDLLRSTAQQGSLTHQLIQAQGQIQVNSFQEQASSYQAMAKAADMAAGGGIFGGLLKGASAALSFFGI